jgi:hypothetical protein
MNDKGNRPIDDQVGRGTLIALHRHERCEKIES